MYYVYDFPKFCDDKEVIDYALTTHTFGMKSSSYKASPLSIYNAGHQCLSKGLCKRLVLLFKDKILGNCGPKLILLLFKLLHTNTHLDHHLSVVPQLRDGNERQQLEYRQYGSCHHGKLRENLGDTPAGPVLLIMTTNIILSIILPYFAPCMYSINTINNAQ